jgi:PhzF family phenazine biosynthesis protein
MARPFRQVDVFTDRLGYGNPVAVVHDADGLSTEQMAAFARWTNLSETTFLLRPTDPHADYRLRIFTTGRELPFAGHPTLGSARAWLAAGGTPIRPALVVQECGAGLVSVRQEGSRLAFAAPPLLREGPVPPADVSRLAAALGIRPEDVAAAQWVDNGPGWVGLLLDSAETVLALRPDAPAFGDFREVGVIGPAASGAGFDFEVRAFLIDESGGLMEDPVTGSLNASLGQWLIGSGRAPRSYVARQGTRRDRRGHVYVQSDGADVWVGGDTVIGVTGTVDL